jgi:hypothetical protein
VLADQLGTRGRVDSQRLGVATFHLMGTIVRELLSHGVSLICEGNLMDGTPVLRDLPPARVVQVHVTAPAATLDARLRARDRHRHPVHYDREAAEEIAARARSGEWEPLRLDGRLIGVDGTGRVDADALARSILEL